MHAWWLKWQTKRHLIGVQLHPLLRVSHEKDTPHFTPFMWWFVGNRVLFFVPGKLFSNVIYRCCHWIVDGGVLCPWIFNQKWWAKKKKKNNLKKHLFKNVHTHNKHRAHSYTSPHMHPNYKQRNIHTHPLTMKHTLNYTNQLVYCSHKCLDIVACLHRV